MQRRSIAQQLRQCWLLVELDEADSWELEAGKKYWVSRNDSSIIAFQLPTGSVIEKWFDHDWRTYRQPMSETQALAGKNN